MKTTLVILILILSISCNQEKGIDKNLMFDYDEIDYYYLKISPSLVELQKNSEPRPYKYNDAKVDNHETLPGDLRTPDERKLASVLYGNEPKSLINQHFIITIQKYYSKAKISPDNFNEINEVYQEKKINNPDMNSVAPIYSDILVFKKDKKIIGISKLCFTCGSNITLGTSKDTFNLIAETQQGSNSEKLRSILKSTNKDL